MTIRSKFKLTEIKRNYCNMTAATLIFEPRYDTSIPEDQRFQKCTPSGRFEMLVDNPLALAQFELGKEYYFDATPAEAAAPAA